MDDDEDGDYVEDDDMYVDHDDDEYTAPALAPQPKKHNVKGKGKQVIPAENDQDQPPASHAEKRRASPKPTGSVKTPACARCIKSGQTCYEQAGFSSACIFCARIKMKCDLVTDGEEKKVVKIRVINPVLTSKQPGPSKEPATKKQRALVKSQPVLAPKKQPAQVKSQRVLASKKQLAQVKSQPVPVPVKKPALAASPQVPAIVEKIRKADTTPTINVLPMVLGTIRHPLKGTFAELEASDRKMTFCEILYLQIGFIDNDDDDDDEEEEDDDDEYTKFQAYLKGNASGSLHSLGVHKRDCVRGVKALDQVEFQGGYRR